jgi:hypothetical protein
MDVCKQTLLLILAFTLEVLPGQNAYAATINQTYSGQFPGSVTGTLPDQSSVLQLSLSFTSGGSFTASTTSYGTGGFQPNLTLFNPAGVAIANQSATPPSTAVADPGSGLRLDGTLTASSLTAGTYTLTLTDWALGQSPSARSLADGFTFNLGNGTSFTDVAGSTRTGNYTINVAFAQGASAVPEPAPWILTIISLPAIAVMVRRRKGFTTELKEDIRDVK